MRRGFSQGILSVALGIVTVVQTVSAQSLGPVPGGQNPGVQNSGGASRTQGVLDQAAQRGNFTFIVFYKEDAVAGRKMYEFVGGDLQARKLNGVVTMAKVTDPSEKELVARFGIGRAPMPMTIAVAPNGAVTGLFPREVQGANIDAAIVPPTMMRCMKQLQDQKLVFVCLTKSDRAVVPAGVKELQTDPDFKDRVTLVSMRATDPSETRFLDQMKVNPEQVSGAYAVLIAPPGVLIGHYDGTASKDDIAAAIHKAGQCCDDVNCKHNRPAAPQAKRPTTGRN